MTKLRAAIYERISRDPTGREAGVRRQDDECRQRVSQRKWTLVDVYRDNDISASNRKRRPAFERLREDIKGGRVEVLVTWHPDRLTRHPRELEDLVDLIEATGVTVSTIQAGDYDLSTADGRMHARVTGAFARHEQELKSERLKSQRRQAAREGLYMGGPRPFCYGKDGTTLRKREVAQFHEAKERFLNGESRSSIVKDWDRRKLKTTRGKRWTVQSLTCILANPRYAGLRVDQGEIIGPAEWPAIIDRATHERLVAMIGNPRQPQRGRPPTQLLSAGLGRCGRCGGPLRSSKRIDGSRRYVCEAGPGRVGCGRVAVQAEPVEELVVEAVMLRLDTPTLAKAVRGPKKQDDRKAEKELAAAEAKRDELADMFAVGEISRVEWQRARRGVEQRIEKATAAIANTNGTAVLAEFAKPGVLRARWPELSLDRRRAILGAVIDRVTVAPVEIRGRRSFDPSRVNVTWRV